MIHRCNIRYFTIQLCKRNTYVIHVCPIGCAVHGTWYSDNSGMYTNITNVVTTTSSTTTTTVTSASIISPVTSTITVVHSEANTIDNAVPSTSTEPNIDIEADPLKDKSTLEKIAIEALLMLGDTFDCDDSKLNENETIPLKRSLINQMCWLQMHRSSHRPNVEEKAVKRRKRKNRVRRKCQLHRLQTQTVVRWKTIQ